MDIITKIGDMNYLINSNIDNITDCIDLMTRKGLDIGLTDFIFFCYSTCFNNLDPRYLTELAFLNSESTQFNIDDKMIKKYNINIKKMIKLNNLILNKDYIITHRGKTTMFGSKSYLLTIPAFKKCLIRSEFGDIYINYIMNMETCYNHYLAYLSKKKKM
jgi:hypothetical protein